MNKFYACTRGLFGHEDQWGFDTKEEAQSWINREFNGQGYIKTDNEVKPESQFEEERLK